MTFTIREPQPHDAATTADLHVATWKEAYAHLLSDDYSSEEYAEGRHRMWHELLAHMRDDMTVRVAERDGAIIAFALTGSSSGPETDEAPRDRMLYAIYVLSAHYGTGAGQALDAALGDAPAMLWVAKENPRAIAFYLRNGFQFDGVEQTDPHMPMITDVRMLR